MLKIALALTFGLLLGIALGGWFWLRTNRAQVVAEQAHAEQARLEALAQRAAAETAQSAAEASASRREPAPSEVPAESDAGEPLFSERLREHAREGLAKGWSRVRRGEGIPEARIQQGTREYRELVRDSPAEIGARLAERETESEQALADARAGGAFALLESMIAKGAGPFPELAGDPAAFDRFFPREAVERARVLDAFSPAIADEVDDGLTLQYGAGVFAVFDFLAHRRPTPREVTLAGAGMGQTLFVLDRSLSGGDSLRRFEVRDATVLVERGYFFDQRGGPATIVLDRVRSIGFDMGAGASCCMSFNDGVALYAKNSRFEGGYGRSPEHGTLFDVRHAGLLARFESCTVSSTRIGVSSMVGGATVVFANCQLVDLLDDPLAEAEGRRGIVFANTNVQRRPAGQPVERRDVNELFPDWRARLNR